MDKVGKILLFPCPIAHEHIDSLSIECIENIRQTTHFIVERAKTARHFLKALNHPCPIATIQIHELGSMAQEDEMFLMSVHQGHDIGIISEAGCPGIADPGAEIVAWAHRNNIEVVPYVGPSSILLALMSSGFSGQSFAFHGYLSNKKPDIGKDLKHLETQLTRSGQTQIWMETPYRNSFIIEACIHTLSPKTKLSIACDINSPSATIKTKTIDHWSKSDYSIYHKRPCIFSIGK